MAAPRLTDPVQAVHAALGSAGKVQRQGDGWVSRCPAHDDHRHSLSIGVGRDGRALLTCHAGCTLDAITAALGLLTTDLFPPKQERAESRMTATYAYTDEHGAVLYEVCRYYPKDFKQRVPQPGGGYSWKIGDTPRVWYRLPQLVQGLAAGKVVFVCEGEKDADALAALGLTATSLAGGAAFTGSRHWPSVAIDWFRGAKVVLLPDNDEPGRTHMARIAERLSPVASWVRTVALPGLGDKGDVSDWLEAGGDVPALKALVAGVPTATAPAPTLEHEPEPIPSRPNRMLTAFGNADRFLDAYDHELRSVPQFGAWYCWDGMRWQQDAALLVAERAKQVIRDLMREATQLEDPDHRRAMCRWAAKCQTPGQVEALLDVARSDPRVVRTAAQWDANLDVLNVANGIVDLRTGVLRPHDRAENHTKVVAVAYHPDAPCPRWEAFLARVVPDPEVRTMLRIAVGYSLTGHTREQCLFLLWGSGRNGKSTFFEILRLLAGDYAVQADFETFLDKGMANGGARNDLARLHGARVVTTSEASEGKRLNEALVKSLTGGDTIAARFLYKEAFEFQPQFALWMAANHRPVIRGTDDGIWRRLRLIPFTVQIPPDEVDKALPEALRAELPGILAWAVSGAMQWYRDGLPMAHAVASATQAYRDESDSLAPFIDERCEIGDRLSVGATALYEAYAEWAKNTGEHLMSQTVFGRRLTDRGFEASRSTTSGAKIRLGLRLVTTLEGYNR
jgi:putative DNA primase/helicase